MVTAQLVSGVQEQAGKAVNRSLLLPTPCVGAALKRLQQTLYIKHHLLCQCCLEVTCTCCTACGQQQASGQTSKHSPANNMCMSR
jgi:hypothetical protein